MRTSSVSASTEAWPSASIRASSARTASSGWPSAAAIRAAARSSPGSAGSPGRMAVSMDQPRLGGRPGVEQPVDEPGRQQDAQVGGQGGEGGLDGGEALGVAHTGAAPPSASQRPWLPGQAAATASGPSGVSGAPLHRAGEVDEEGAVLDGGVGEGGEQRLGLGAEAEADVEPAPGRAPPRGSARRTRSTSWRANSGIWAVRGRPFDQAPTSRRASSRQTAGAPGPRFGAGGRVSRS